MVYRDFAGLFYFNVCSYRYLITFCTLLSESWDKRFLVKQVEMDGLLFFESCRQLLYLHLGSDLLWVTRKQKPRLLDANLVALLCKSWSSGEMMQ